jgi:hypothetical protein
VKGWLIFLAVPIVLLLLSAAVGLRYFPLICGGAIALLFSLTAASIQMRSPCVGLNILLLSAVAFPLHFGPNDDLSLTAVCAIGICGCWLADRLLRQRPLALTISSTSGLGSLLLLTAGASALIAQFTQFPADPAPARAQVGGLLIVGLSVGLFIFAASTVTNVEDIRLLTWRFLFAGALVLVLYRPSLDAVAQRTTAPETIGSVFWSWLVSLSAAQALFNGRLHPLGRLACASLALASVVDALLMRADWASGWLPPLIALSVLLLVRFPRTAMIGALTLAPIIGYLSIVAFDSVLEVESYSLVSRIAAWKTLWQVVSMNPFIGLGPANYYYFTDLFPTLGWYVKFSSHHQYIDLLAQVGVVGLALFAAFAVAIIKGLWGLQRRLPSGFERAFVLGSLGATLASLASGMLADWILPFVYNIGLKGFRSSVLFWLFLGLAMAMRRMYDDQVDSSPPTVPVPVRALSTGTLRHSVARSPGPVLR